MKYHVIRDVLQTHGSQTFEVEASSFEEARDKVIDGKGEIVSEEIEVQELSMSCMVENKESNEWVEINSSGKRVQNRH